MSSREISITSTQWIIGVSHSYKTSPLQHFNVWLGDCTVA